MSCRMMNQIVFYDPDTNLPRASYDEFPEIINFRNGNRAQIKDWLFYLHDDLILFWKISDSNGDRRNDQHSNYLLLVRIKRGLLKIFAVVVLKKMFLQSTTGMARKMGDPDFLEITRMALVDVLRSKGQGIVSI